MLQEIDGVRVGVPDSNRGAGCLGNRNEFLKLAGDRFRSGVVVEEHIASRAGNLMLSRDTESDTLYCGSAVDKKQLWSLLHHLHQPLHVAGVLGKQTPHVIVDAADVGNRRNVFLNRTDKLLVGHVQGNAPWS